MTSGSGKVPRLRELTDDDVLLGRGFPAIENEGNCRFRDLVRTRSAEYHAAYRRHTKDSIAREVVSTIHRRKGRFLSQIDSISSITGVEIPAGARVWVEADESAVLIKAKQALRDHSEGSQDARPVAKRRPAAGSGNLVLEWVTPPSAQIGSEGGRVPNSPVASLVASAPGATASTSTLPFPLINAASIPRNSHIASLLTPQQLAYLNAAPNNLGALRLPPVAVTERGPGNNAMLFDPAASRRNLGIMNASQSMVSPAVGQLELQQSLLNRAPGSAGGGTNTWDALTTLLLHGRSDASLASVRDMLQAQSTTVSVPDQGQSLSNQSTSSSSNNIPFVHQGTSGNSVGSKAIAAINSCIGKTSSSSGRDSNGIAVCGVEACLLKVLCSKGLPLPRVSTIAVTAATTEVVGGWRKLGEQLQLECREMDAATATVATRLSSDYQTLARAAVFLLSRCLDSTKTVASLTSTTTNETPQEGKRRNLEQDSRVVQQALSHWRMELDSFLPLDGSFYAGTIAEALNSVAMSEGASSSTSRVPVTAVLSFSESQTIVETIAMFLRLQWVFQYPMATIIALLSTQEGDTSRDYLMLKGVLEHGLTNELEFRTQGTSTTRNEVEDRIFLLSRVIYQNLENSQKVEALRSLQQIYASLLAV